MKCIQNRLILKPEKITKAGKIELPKGAAESANSLVCIVVEAGPGDYLPGNGYIDNPVKKDDRVLINPKHCVSVRIDQVDYFIAEPEDVLVVLDSNENAGYFSS